jgi:hypothetical protein
MRYRWMVLLLICVPSMATAQWLHFPEPGAPLTRDGKVNLSAPAPRTAEGKPDLSGVWMHERTSPEEMVRLYGAVIEEAIKVDVPGMEIGTQHKYGFNIMVDVKPGEASPRPAALKIMRQRAAQADPAAGLCAGVPAFPVVGLLSEPIKIVQAPRTTIILYEAGSLHRQIFSDGREFPKEFELPAFNGYSVGRWNGDVFVVETRGFNDKSVLDIMGHPHSEALKVTERFRRPDFGHLDVEMTFDDPTMYTAPFTVKIPHDLVPDNDIFEMFCENEKDREHIQNAKPR